MDEYTYSGPVMEFDICVDRCWKASTIAQSEKKARSNLAYRYKKEHNKPQYTRITLLGKLTKV